MIMIAVECNVCGARVAAEKNKKYAIHLMRRRLERNGWLCRDKTGEDYCPTCAKQAQQGAAAVLTTPAPSPVVVMTREQHLLKVLREHARSRIRQHEGNLLDWSEDGGCLLPTEPDPDERECVRRELRAAVYELNELLKLLGVNEGPERGEETSP